MNKKNYYGGYVDKTLMNEYKQYYYDQMSQYDWKYCTAFHLTTEYLEKSGRSVKRSKTPFESKNFILKNILSVIKKRLLVRDHNGHIKYGIPFYAYYVVSKQLDDICYHAHIVMNFQDEYFNNVNGFIQTFTGGSVLKLKNRNDTVKMIIYMLQKGNLVIDSDNEWLVPAGYNLNVDKRHFN